MAEPLALLFRDRTPQGAATQAKAWAKAEGMRVRTLATIKQRDDLPTWGDDADPYVTLVAYEVVLVVDALPDPLPTLPTLPEAPTLPLWGA
mgnify:FL=1